MKSLRTKLLTGVAVAGMLMTTTAPASAGGKGFGFGGGGGGGGRGIGRALGGGLGAKGIGRALGGGGGNKPLAKGLRGGSRPNLGAKLLGKSNHSNGLHGQHKGYSHMFHNAQVYQGNKSYNHTKYNSSTEQTSFASVSSPTTSSKTSNYFGDQQPSSSSPPSYTNTLASVTTVTSSTVAVATGEVPLLPLADLVLTDLRALSPGNGSDLGPVLQLTIANQGPSPTPAFQATIVAAVSKEKLDTAANATAQVNAIEPGQSTQVEVRLPVEALALEDANGPTMFKVLGVALDDLNQVDELDEQNNKGLVYREDIRSIENFAAPQSEPAASFASNWSSVPRMLSLPRQ